MFAVHVRTMLAASALLAVTAVPASAQSLASDAKCFIVSNLFAKAGDEKAKRAASEARFFYLGRLNGTAPQIEAAIVAQGKSVTKDNAGTTMQACARAMAQKASQVQAIGQRLSKSGAK